MNGIHEVRGSIPLGSTIFINWGGTAGSSRPHRETSFLVLRG